MPTDTARATHRVAGLLIAAVLASLCTGLLIASGADATEFPGQGTVSGTVTDSSGPVGNVLLVFIGDNNNQRHVRTAANGSYSVDVWPDTYSVGAQPPPGSSDGYATLGGIVVSGGTTTPLDISLPSSPSYVQLSGTAKYADNAPDAGVEVLISPLDYESHVIHPLRTDEGGHWDAGQIETGTYSISYSVIKWNGSNPTFTSVGSPETVMLSPGVKVLSTALAGPKPNATLFINLESPEGFPNSRVPVEIVPVGGGAAAISAPTGMLGQQRTSLGTGSYVITAGDAHEEGSGSITVSVTDGQFSETHLKLQRQPFQVPGGTVSHKSYEELGWLNAQRAQWGIPAGLLNVPEWSQACSAHNAYEALNSGELTHYEQSNLSGFSEGGAWAGANSILATGGGWSLEDNPWNDAPIHLNQLMTPDLQVIGLDDSHGNQCATTWPGISRIPPPRGTINTYPGDGTVGLPPSEFAAELPKVPGEEVGITGLAGRELFVYEEGTGPGYCGGVLDIQSASLSSPNGPAEVRWVDQISRVGGYLTGGIIIPVKPLEAETVYSATVVLAPLEEDLCSYSPSKEPVGQITHSWSFTTGPANPDGHWPHKYPKAKRKHHRKRHVHPRPTLKLRRRGNHMIAIGNYFKPHKLVVLRRQPGNSLIRRVRPNRKGQFQVSLKWGHLPTLTVIAHQGKKTVKTRMKATGPRASTASRGLGPRAR